MDLLKTDEVSFMGLATPAAVQENKTKNTKTKKLHEIHNNTQQHKKQTKEKANYKTTIYQDRYIYYNLT